MFDKCLEFLSTDQNMRIVFNTLEGNYALCLLANMIQMAHIEREHALPESFYPTFVVSFSNMYYIVTKNLLIPVYDGKYQLYICQVIK